MVRLTAGEYLESGIILEDVVLGEREWKRMGGNDDERELCRPVSKGEGSGARFRIRGQSGDPPSIPVCQAASIQAQAHGSSRMMRFN